MSVGNGCLVAVSVEPLVDGQPRDGCRLGAVVTVILELDCVGVIGVIVVVLPSSVAEIDGLLVSVMVTRALLVSALAFGTLLDGE